VHFLRGGTTRMKSNRRMHLLPLSYISLILKRKNSFTYGTFCESRSTDQRVEPTCVGVGD
jgi:hypothetical protein